MENTLTIIIALAVGVIIAYFIFGKKKEGSSDTGLQLILTQLNELSRTVDNKIGESQKQVHETLRFHQSESSKIIREITEELTRVNEGQKQVVGFADQLQDLQNILKNPKHRGTILGEYYLETILSKVLPMGSYQTQYEFKNGEKVDAVVIIDNKIIPIDSKFSLENYNRIIDANKDNKDPEIFIQEFKRDVKKRIDETAKYIRPEENTLDFAFMFIPHEAIYYDLLISEIGALKINSQDLMEYAFKQKVIIVSPTSFIAYLHTVHQGLKALRFEKQTEEIRKWVEKLGNHIKAYEKYHNAVGKAIGTVYNQYNLSSGELKKIDKDVLQIANASPELNILELEKQKTEE